MPTRLVQLGLVLRPGEPFKPARHSKDWDVPPWLEHQQPGLLREAMTTEQLPIGITCHSCRWYVEDRCRRHSPGPEGWPFTGEEDFCGDWDRRWERADGKWRPVV